jgi:hypothetical protein
MTANKHESLGWRQEARRRIVLRRGRFRRRGGDGMMLEMLLLRVWVVWMLQRQIMRRVTMKHGWGGWGGRGVILRSRSGRGALGFNGAVDTTDVAEVGVDVGMMAVTAHHAHAVSSTAAIMVVVLLVVVKRVIVVIVVIQVIVVVKGKVFLRERDTPLVQLPLGTADSAAKGQPGLVCPFW